MSLGLSYIKDVNFIEMMFVIVLGWILVALWQRCLDNLSYNTLGLNKDSTYHTFIIALSCTIIFLSFVLSFNTISADLIESDFKDGLTPPKPPGPIYTNSDFVMNKKITF